MNATRTFTPVRFTSPAAFATVSAAPTSALRFVITLDELDDTASPAAPIAFAFFLLAKKLRMSVTRSVIVGGIERKGPPDLPWPKREKFESDEDTFRKRTKDIC